MFAASVTTIKMGVYASINRPTEKKGFFFSVIDLSNMYSVISCVLQLNSKIKNGSLPNFIYKGLTPIFGVQSPLSVILSNVWFTK